MDISASDDSLGTFADTISGKYLIGGIPTGTYSFGFLPADDFTEQTIENIQVDLGSITEVNTVFFK